MTIADELKKLQHLHESGGLTADEFAAAKSAVLGTTKMDSELAMAVHFDARKLNDDLDRLDREWQLEREQYTLPTRYGGRQVPTRFMSIASGALIVGFGIFWCAAAATGSGPPSVPFFGIIPIVAGIGLGVYSYSKAVDYEEAFLRYQRRRERLLEGPPDDRFARS